MKTLSITQIQQALGQVVRSFQHVEGYKVEVSMWDHTQQPILQLYVACTVNNEHTSIHTQSQSLPEALEEVKQWYKAVTAPKYAMQY
jgi:hypothetical protein